MPGGRPTKYNPAMCEQVEKLCLLGATDEQIADFFGVATSTIYEWANEHEEFSEARKNGKLGADANVAKALYHRAIGYEHKAVKIMSFEGSSFEHEYTEHYPPDTAAAFIWLKNRAGWRDRQELTGADGGPIQTQEVTDEVLLERAAQLRNRLAAVMPSGTPGPNGNGKH